MDPRSQEFSAAKRAGAVARSRQQPGQRRAAAWRLAGLSIRIFLRYVFRFVLLGLGMALLTYGLLDWHATNFDLSGLMLYDNDWRPHPLHLAAGGLAMVPPTIWEIFQLEMIREAHSVGPQHPGPAEDGTAAPPDAE